MAIPYSLCPWLSRQFTDDNGDPLAGYYCISTAAGLPSTPKLTYASSSGTANPQAVPLDAAGRATLFLAPGGYDFYISPTTSIADAVQTVAGVEDVGQTYLAQLGLLLTGGARDVTSGYTVLDADLYITVDSHGGTNPCVINLPDVASRTQPIGIKNRGDVPLAVTPHGSQSIDYLSASTALTVPAASSPTYPSVILMPDSVNLASWWVWAAYGLG